MDTHLQHQMLKESGLEKYIELFNTPLVTEQLTYDHLKAMGIQNMNERVRIMQLFKRKTSGTRLTDERIQTDTLPEDALRISTVGGVQMPTQEIADSSNSGKSSGKSPAQNKSPAPWDDSKSPEVRSPRSPDSRRSSVAPWEDLDPLQPWDNKSIIGPQPEIIYQSQVPPQDPKLPPKRRSIRNPLSLQLSISEARVSETQKPEVTTPSSLTRKKTIDKKKRLSAIFNKSESDQSEDIMKLKSVRERCIRVYDTKNQSHIIDVSKEQTARDLRQKIYGKFPFSETTDVELYIDANQVKSDEFVRDTSLDDLTLMEICKNAENPLRGFIVIDRKRHPHIDKDMPVPLKKDKTTTSAALLYSMDDFGSEAKNDKLRFHRLNNFFGEMPPTAGPGNSKVHAFFGEDDLSRRKTTLKQSKKQPASMSTKRLLTLTRALDSEEPERKSKKLDAFFGDRPPSDLIADHLEHFFPGINEMKVNDEQPSLGKTIKDVLLRKKTAKMPLHAHQQQNFARRQTELANVIERKKSVKRSSTLRKKTLSESVSPVSPTRSPPIKTPTTPNRSPSVRTKMYEEEKILPTAASIEEWSKLMESLEVNSKQKLKEELNQPVTLMDTEKEPLDVSDDFDETTDDEEDEEEEGVFERTESLMQFEEEFKQDLNNPAAMKWIKGPMIGAGSFGKVFYGANIETGELMAVKQVQIRGSSRASASAVKARQKMLDALHQEINLLKDLDHPNIVRYLGYELEQGYINVFLEYVSGGSVTSALAVMGSFEEILVKSVTAQVLCGLEYLHENRIIHRDIKGGNILIDEDGWAKISDFGISKKNKYDIAYKFNSRMSIQGSVYWMAPEVVKSKGYSAKVDIWSLGCVILEMITSDHPWKQLDEVQTMWRLGRQDKPPFPTESLSQEGVDFVNKCFTTYSNSR